MPRLLAVFVVLVCALSAQEPPPVALVRVSTHSAADAAALAALGLDVVSFAVETEVLIHHSQELAALEGARLAYEFIHRDLVAFYRSRFEAQGARTDGLAPAFGSGSMGGYFTWSECVQFMDELAQDYPDLVAPKVSLGTSHQGRELWMWKISDNPLIDENEPEVLIDALHHAREPISMQAAVWLAVRLTEGYGTDPEITKLVDSREIFIVPVVNPDGYVYNATQNPGGGGTWRKNRRANADGSFGVDLNRNYADHWGFDDFGSSPTPASETYRGPGPFSEPCTLAMKQLAESRNFQLGLTMHSFSPTGDAGWLVIPPAYAQGVFPPQPWRTRYESIAQEVGRLPQRFTAGYTWDLSFPHANGCTEDWWMGSLHGGLQTWAFSCELGSASDGFWPATARIVPICEATFAMQKILLRAAGSDLRIEPGDVAVNEPGGAVAGTWEPGETLEIVAQTTNGGTLDDQVRLRLEVLSPYLTIVSGPVNLGLVGSFSTAGNTGSPMAIQVASNAPPNAIVAFDVVAESPFSLTKRFRVNGRVGIAATAPVGEGFETANAGWTVGAPGDTATSGLWTRQDPNGTATILQPWNPEDDHTPGAGSQCWFTGQGVAGGPVTTSDLDGTSTLVSPVFDLSGVEDATISYWRWFATNGHDQLRVEISNDGGNQWRLLELVMGTDIPWRPRAFRVSDHLPRTSTMRVRFRAADDPNNSLCEAAIDDFAIQGYAPALSLQPSSFYPPVGSTLALALAAPAFPSAYFVVGCSATASQGFATPWGLVPLDLDWLLSTVPLLPTVFTNFSGVLDTQGQAQALVHIPAVPSLGGFTFHAAAALLAPPGEVLAISGALRLTIQ